MYYNKYTKIMSEKDSAEKENAILWGKSYGEYCKGNTSNGGEKKI